MSIEFFSLVDALEKHFPIFATRLKKQGKWRLRLLQWLINEQRIVALQKKYASDGEKKWLAPQQALSNLIHHAFKTRITTSEAARLKKIPQRTLFVANHPLGGLDGLVLLHVLLPHFPNIKIFVNPLLMELRPFNNFFFPIEVFRLNSYSKAKHIKKIFKKNHALIAFPARRVARKNKGKVEDAYWHSRLLQEAFETHRTIVPIRIVAQNSALFYHTAFLRTMWGIQSNIEMLLLPRELLSRAKIHLHLHVGKTIQPHRFSNGKEPPTPFLQNSTEIKNHFKTNTEKPTAHRLRSDSLSNNLSKKNKQTSEKNKQAWEIFAEELRRHVHKNL